MQRRHQRGRDVADVRNNADRIATVKLAHLSRNVALGIVMVQKARRSGDEDGVIAHGMNFR
jgi:hypothetical protein